MINKFMLGTIFHEFMYPPVTKGIKKLTIYENAKSTFKVTRKLYKGKPSKKVLELVVTFGPPNYLDRAIIKKYKGKFPFQKVI